MKYLTKFPIRLKTLRKNKGLTLDAMANLLNIKTRSYQKYEDTGPNGREPRFKTLCFLAKHFSVSSDWLLGISNNQVSYDEEMIQCQKMSKY